MGKLQGYLETEKQLGEAFTQAFGAEAGKKKAIEGIVSSMKASGNEAMVNDMRRVFIALDMEETTRIKPLVEELIDSSVDVIWAPDIFGTVLVNHSIREIAGAPLISLSETPMVGSSALRRPNKSLAVG